MAGGNRNYYASAGFAILVALLAGACSDGGQQREVGGMRLSVSTDPAVLQVGRDASVRATLQRNGGAVGDCQLRMRQFMPGMEMSSDNTWLLMEAGDSPGTYRTTSGEFSMGGDWQLEFDITCGGSAKRVALPYHLEWPE